jgi:hypothetical protein
LPRKPDSIGVFFTTRAEVPCCNQTSEETAGCSLPVTPGRLRLTGDIWRRFQHTFSTVRRPARSEDSVFRPSGHVRSAAAPPTRGTGR